MQLLVHVFINLLRSCGYCESALSMGTHMFPHPPPPPPQGFIQCMYMFLQRSLRLQALVKSNSHWILIKIPLIDY